MMAKVLLQLCQNSYGDALSSELRTQFSEGYRNSIYKIYKLLQGTVAGDFVVELFEQQWRDIMYTLSYEALNLSAF